MKCSLTQGSKVNFRIIKPDFNLGVRTNGNFLPCVMIRCKYISLILKLSMWNIF